MKALFQTILRIAEPLLLAAVPAATVQSAVERALTIPQKDRMAIYQARGLTADEITEAERLNRVFTDAGSDLVVYVASAGSINAD